MFTDLHEEIAATFARLEGQTYQLGGFRDGMPDGFQIDGRAPKEMLVEQRKRDWVTEKWRLRLDPALAERRKAYKRAHYKEWRERNPEKIRAALDTEKKRKASDPEYRRKRNAVSEASKKRKRAAKRLDAQRTNDRDRMDGALERGGEADAGHTTSRAVGC